MIIRFPTNARFDGSPPPLSLWGRFRLWLAQPPKAPVFQIKNPRLYIARMRRQRGAL